MNTEEFIERAKKIHGNKYDYSKTKYVDCYTKVCIICNKHGEFWQLPNVHLKGSGCKECGLEAIKSKNRKKNYTLDNFIKDAKNIHGDKYDYSKVEYVDKKTNVCIICPKHGEFWQKPYAHLKGSGCLKCIIDDKKSNENIFIEKAKKKHHNKYDYSKVEYINNHTKVCIICPEHGEFWVTPNNHLSKYDIGGCPKCKKKKIGEIKKKSLEDFIKESNIIHNKKYSYDKVDYNRTDEQVIITCPIHGDFIQRPQDHLRGHGCPKCANQQSLPEEEIYNHISSIIGEKEIKKRINTILNKNLEIDIFIPKYNFGIEYNGLRWHTEKFGKDRYYHLNKTVECEKKGIKLIHIFEDEWEKNKTLVLNKIDHILNIGNNLPKIMARKTYIKEIEKESAIEFLEQFHIQGFVPSTVYLGCFLDNKLIGVTSFTEESEKMWNLTRMATDINYICSGVCNKMVSYFKKNYLWKEIKTFADRRWTNDKLNNIYTKMGFNLEKILKPDYRYVVGKERIHKFNFRKQTIAKKYNLPLSMTELEMTELLGFYRIWDCGLFKYTLKNDNN